MDARERDRRFVEHVLRPSIRRFWDGVDADLKLTPEAELAHIVPQMSAGNGHAAAQAVAQIRPTVELSAEQRNRRIDDLCRQVQAMTVQVNALTQAVNNLHVIQEATRVQLADYYGLQPQSFWQRLRWLVRG